MIELTTAYKKIKSLDKEIKVVQGGTGAGKTFSTLIDYHLTSVQTPNLLSTIVTETYPQLRDGVIKDMKSIFNMSDLVFDEFYRSGDKELIYPNGSVIQFRNIDNKDFNKAKGARRDRLYLNEANRMAYASVDQMIGRSHIDTIIDFNPDREFWAHTELIGQDYVDFISLTYLDNERIPEAELRRILRRIEKSKEPDASDGIKNWVQIYAYGQLGSYSERRIYSYEFIDEIPDTAVRLPSGMDFGQSPAPTILVDVYVDGINLIIDEVFCANNLMPEKIAGAERESIVDRMESIGFPKGQLIIADSAGRVSILDMRKHKYNVRGVKKYTGGQGDGIRKIRSYNVQLTKRSTTIKKEIESWFWKEDKNGLIIPEPDGHEPDGLVSVRYVMMTHSAALHNFNLLVEGFYLFCMQWLILSSIPLWLCLWIHQRLISFAWCSGQSLVYPSSVSAVCSLTRILLRWYRVGVFWLA